MLQKIEHKILKTMNKYHLIKPNESILISVSGGADSIALLRILHSINIAKKMHLRLLVAHLNHRLRGNSSEEDERFVREISKELSLPVFSKSIKIKKIAHDAKHSLEETARKERYKFLLEVAQSQKVSVVATGHTANDNAETILHRIIRGTGLLGLEGIPIKRPLYQDLTITLVRPLLFLRKKEILEYLENKQISYRTDTTNYDTTFMRNKIRHKLIPLLEEHYNFNIKNALVQLSQIIHENNEHLMAECKNILQEAVSEETENACTIDSRFLAKQPRILQYLTLQEILKKMDIPLKQFNYSHYTSILDDLIKKGRKRAVQLPGKLYLWNEHGHLHLEKGFPEKCPKLPKTAIHLPGKTQIPNTGSIIAEILDARNVSLELYKSQKTKNEEIFDLQWITPPVFLRSRESGDTISPLGTTGRKKLKRLFIDKKIPCEERNHIPIIVMGNQPIWVVGVCIDNHVKVTPATKTILKLIYTKRH